ncbi:MAG TPA: hypothetical protein VJS30_12945 [Paraburkholderia sp.]|nr:hypothetical protein [Paraburkholderia sp.]
MKKNMPLSAISLPTANLIFNWANIALIVGAVLVAVGTIAAVWSAGIRDRFADERVAANEKATAQANNGAARANAEAARANAEAAHARLEQERLRAQLAWRRVTPEQANQLMLAIRGHHLSVWLTFVGNDPESTVFRTDLNDALTHAGVETQFFSGYARAVGLQLLGGSPEDRRLLLHAFHTAGIPLEDSPEPSQMHGANNTAEILVGTKPPPDGARAFQQ